jgi:hypothetical protein
MSLALFFTLALPVACSYGAGGRVPATILCVFLGGSCRALLPMMALGACGALLLAGLHAKNLRSSGSLSG